MTEIEYIIAGFSPDEQRLWRELFGNYPPPPRGVLAQSIRWRRINGIEDAPRKKQNAAKRRLVKVA